MTQQIIQVGPAPNDGLGDPIRTAFIKCNDNFTQLYERAQVSPPSTLIGSLGDLAGMYAYDSSYFYYCFANYNGSTAIWAELAPIGNISATQILNGTSSVAIANPNGNATVGINGTANVAVFTSTGANITGYVTAGGNLRGGNIFTAGQVSATGNITGNYILGNGSQLTGLPATYSDSNVTSLLSTFGSNTISTTGNITSGYLFGNGSQLTGLPATYSNSNVTSLLVAFGSNTISMTGTITSGNITGANILTTGNITAQGTVSATGDIITAGSFIGNFAGNITGNLVVNGSNTQVLFNDNGNANAVGGMTYNKDSNTFIVLGTVSSQGNTIGGNVLTGGLISATGNITGNYILGNGSQLIGLAATYNNSNVTSLLAAFGSNTISTTGTITGGNITGANILTGGLISATGTLTSGNLATGGTASASGNITGANILTGGLMSSTGNATHGNILTGGTVSATGNIQGNYLRSTIDVIVGGNISTTNLTGTGVSVTANITGGNILTGGTVSATGNIQGNYFVGNGSQLTGVSGTYSNSNVSSLMAAFGSNTISTTGTITSGNITGANILTNGLISASGTVTGASVVGGAMTGSSISVTGAVTGASVVGTIYTNSINNTGSNATGNIGSSSTYFNTVFATATTALYADLAECYLADEAYAPGTVLSFGGDNEVTISSTDADALIVGVVSTNPAYKMNSGLTGDHVVTVALTGRVPCRVQGPVTRGAMMVSAGTGRARAESNPAMGTVIGKAVESFTGDIGTIEIVVGRL